MRGSSRHGWGARKKHISSGHKGGKGMSGTGKGAGHKKTLVEKLYGHGYFGKQGITSKSTRRKKNFVMNVYDIEKNIDSLKKEYGKKEGKEEILELLKYKILGEGEIKIEVNIKAKAASKSAIEKIQAAGGKIEIESLEENEEASEEKIEKKEETISKNKKEAEED